MPSGNGLAALMLLLVVPATLFTFAQWRVTAATLLMMVGGLLVLPERSAFQLPVIHAVDKFRMVVICCGIAHMVCAKREYQNARLMRGREWFFLCALPIAQVATTLANMDMPAGVQGAMSPQQIPGLMLECLLDVTGPFLVGRMVHRTIADATLLFRVFVGAALVYLPLAIFEMSRGPVLHLWLYGFLQGSVEQARRGDAFRPTVFFGHGLALALFMYVATVSSIVLSRASKSNVLGLSSKVAALCLLGTFPFLRSSAALTYVALTSVAVLFKPKTQVKIAFGLSIATWAYMSLRVFDRLPIWDLIELVARISPERANSLGFRFANEDILMARAFERPLFGWGGYGRNLVEGAVSDGAWIIVYGSGGLLQLFITFGLLGAPIYLAKRRLSLASPEAQTCLAGLSLIVAFCNLDLLPNGFFNYMHLFLAGSLTGLAWGITDDRKNTWLPLLFAWYASKRRRQAASNLMG